MKTTPDDLWWLENLANNTNEPMERRALRAALADLASLAEMEKDVEWEWGAPLKTGGTRCFKDEGTARSWAQQYYFLIIPRSSAAAPMEPQQPESRADLAWAR